MRHKFLTVAVATVLIGLVSGQQPFRNGFQSYNYASAGNGPQAPVKYGNPQNFAPYNQASFFSNSRSSIPGTNVQPNPAAGPAGASFFPQISNQPQGNNFQFTGLFGNTANSQLSPADSVMSALENNPLIKQFLPGPTNTNPATNGAQFIQNTQNRFPPPNVFGSNPLPNVNPSYSAQMSNVASPSFFPQSSNQAPVNNFQFSNSFYNPAGQQDSLANSVMSSISNNPVVKQILQNSANTNPSTNGAQLIQNFQNRFPFGYITGSNPSPNGAQLIQNFQNRYINPQPSGFNPLPSDKVLSSLERNPIFTKFFNDPASQMQVINQVPNPKPNTPKANTDPDNSVQNSPDNVPLIKKFLRDPANQQFLINRVPDTSPNSNASLVVQDLIKKIPVMKQFLANPANQQLLINRVPSVNSSTDTLDFLEKNPLVKQFLNNPKSQKVILNKLPRPTKKPKRRNRRPGSKHPKSSPKSNPQESYNTAVPPTDDSLNNPIPSTVSILSPNSFPDYSLPADVPIEYPKSDFPKGFFEDMLKSLETDSKSASSAAAKQPKNRRKFKGQRSRTGSPSKSSLSANIGPITLSPTDGIDLLTLNNIRTVNPVTDLIFTDSSQSGSTLNPVYPPDIPKQLTLNDVKIIDSSEASKAPSTGKRKCKKRKRINVTGLLSKTPSNSDLTAATAISLLMTTPEVSSSESLKVIDTKITNQNSDLSIGNVNPLTDSKFTDSSQSGTTLTPIYPSDIPKQLSLKDIKVLADSLSASKAPSTRKRKCKKRKKINVTDLVSKTISNSDLTPATATSLLITTPQISSSESVTVIDTKNRNQDSDLTTVGLVSIQPKKKKKCNRNRVNPKAEIENSGTDLLRGKSDILPSVTDIHNLSKAGNNNDTDSRSSSKVQKSRKCKLKKERLKPSSTKGPTAVSTSGPTTTILIDTTTQNVATTDSSVTITDAGKTTTVGSDSCGDDEVWWDCKPLNNTCTNVARGRSQKNFVCEPGCYCADDLVKDVDGTCVDPDDCKPPVCKDEDHEELTDCIINCNRCEDDCHKCYMQSCVPGCDCEDGYKRTDNGTCIMDAKCPPCPTVKPAVISD